MKFEELIGTEIFVAFKGRIGSESSEPGSLPVKLVGVEHSGIWVESDKLRSYFEQSLWAVELQEGGPEAVGKSTIEHFLPFSEVRFILAVRGRE